MLKELFDVFVGAGVALGQDKHVYGSALHLLVWNNNQCKKLVHFDRKCS